MAQGRMDVSGFPDFTRDRMDHGEPAGTRYRGSNANVASPGRMNPSPVETIDGSAGIFSDGDAGGKPKRPCPDAGRKRGPAKSAATFPPKRIARFVEALLLDAEDDCRSLSATAFADCGSPQKIVEMLFRPAADIIGKGWQTDEIDFVKVTIATARMQRMFRRMAYENPPLVVPDVTRRALLAPAPGDQHAFGLLVVEDAFQRAGWDVDCCGCDEAAEMFCLAAANEYRIIGISVSAERSLPELLSLVGMLRAKSRNGAVVLMAGGSVVTENRQLAMDAGFDLTATDAASAVTLAGSAAPSNPGAGYLSQAAE